jgi:NADH-quinone oxidoreductase subunit G
MSVKAEQAVETVNIEVDGIAMEVPRGSMIIEATDKAGIEIPRFCYHEKLSIAANCRMCLVDVEKAPKPLPACATPVLDGMKVFTRSRRAVDAQHGVMEFLLINHPLDCPICDQGGECELQDLAMGYGRSVSRCTERKRVVKDKNVGALIQTDMTRCIHCTRCVRFLEEIAGTSEMGGSGRGDRLEIGTCIERSIDSELSGNIIDLCPVGALTNKPFRFSARAWELMAKPSQAAHDAVCSNLFYHSLRGRILRAVPSHNEARNETWLSDRDRFSHFGLYADDRLLEPRVKVDGEWRTVGWEEGIRAAAAAIEESGAELNVLMGASSPTEDYFLAQRLTRALGGNNVDHRLREQDFSDDGARATSPRFAKAVAELERVDTVLLLGSHIRHEAPILGHRIRKAWLGGAEIMAINPVDWNFHFDLVQKSIVPPQALLAETASVAQALAELTGTALPENLSGSIAGLTVEDGHRAMARVLNESENGVVLIGQLGMSHPQSAALRQLATWMADAAGAALNLLPFGGNPVGAWLAGAIPHRGPGGSPSGAGRTAVQMLTEPGGGYLVWDFEPEFDTADAAAALQTLRASGPVVAVTSFVSEALAETADVLLPLAPLAETEGTLHNIDGDAMTLEPAGRVSGACKPGWKILRRLGAELALEGFDQVDITQLQAEMAESLAGEASPQAWDGSPSGMEPGIHRVGEVPMFSVDGLCRRAAALQHTGHAETAFVGLSPADIESLGVQEGDPVKLSQGDAVAELPARAMDELPQGAAWLAGGTPEGSLLGALLGPMKVEKA